MVGGGGDGLVGSNAVSMREGFIASFPLYIQGRSAQSSPQACPAHPPCPGAQESTQFGILARGFGRGRPGDAPCCSRCGPKIIGPEPNGAVVAIGGGVCRRRLYFFMLAVRGPCPVARMKYPLPADKYMMKSGKTDYENCNLPVHSSSPVNSPVTSIVTS